MKILTKLKMLLERTIKMKTLPTGYSIQRSTDDRYRWVDKDGYASVHDHPTMDAAIEAAIGFEEYQKSKITTKWETVK